MTHVAGEGAVKEGQPPSASDPVYIPQLLATSCCSGSSSTLGQAGFLPLPLMTQGGLKVLFNLEVCDEEGLDSREMVECSWVQGGPGGLRGPHGFEGHALLPDLL